jgi:hypothetical protein
MVVRVRGTAVHRLPLIDVIKYPAGRIALVDMMGKKKSGPVAVLNVMNQPSRKSDNRGS